MACGLPVIVPTVGGIAELVDDGVNGYKIDVQHLDDIESCLATLLTDAALYRSLAQGALAVSAKYDVTRMITDVEQVLNS